jgi:acetyltransferase-like isoleucine patch superfamily enzyme
VTISGGTYVNGFQLEIGDRTFLNRSVYFDLSGPVRIGRDIQVGHHVKFVTSEHEIGPASRRAGAVTGRAIIVEDGAWIGAAAVILPGVTIGAGSIVAAAAVVSKDVAPNSIVAGVPARVVRTL